MTNEGLINVKKDIAYQFDSVYSPSTTNEQIFNQTLRNLLDSAMKGYDGSVFCYGQTGSGKTHTMYGNKSDPGLAPRAIEYLFDRIEATPELVFKVTIGFIEIYNEVVNDLLDTNKRNLSLVEVTKGVVIIKDLTETLCPSREDAEVVLRMGENNKHIAATQANEKSSRSHTMYSNKWKSRLRIVIESKGPEKEAYTAAINLVDLAGSECANYLSNGNKCGRMETSCINKVFY